MKFIADQTFKGKDYTEALIEKGEYEACTFIGCNFSTVNLSSMRFIDCELINCNLSSVMLAQTSLQDIFFKDCKILGVDFGVCSDFAFSIRFENCQLDHSSFDKQNLSKTLFKSSKLYDVGFFECDLSSAVFEESDLMNARFNQNNLKKSDFRTASHFVIDPEQNALKGAKFSAHSLAGLLAKYKIRIEGV